MNGYRQYPIAIWPLALFIVIVTFIVYLPALQNGFVNWDDNLYVYENQNIQTISLRLFSWLPEVVIWHPLTMFSLAIDYAIWGMNPLGYHLTSVLIHVFNTFLVFILAVFLIEKVSEDNKVNNKAIIAGTVTAFLFGIHPLHVESVAWVSERKDVLSAFFFLLSLIAYLRYVTCRASKRYIFYLLSLISLAMSLMSKPMAVSLPVVLLILDLYPLERLIPGGRDTKWILIEKLPFFLLSVLASMAAIWVHYSTGVFQAPEIPPFTERIFVAAWAYIFYLFKIIFPTNLAPLYPYPEKISFFTFEYFGCLALVSAITFGAIMYLKKDRLLPAIWFYYLVTLTPVIGIVQVGRYEAADRFVYLPSLSLLFLVGLMVGSSFGERVKRKHQLIISIVVIFTVGILTLRTREQIDIWHDSITLWSHEIRLFPEAATAFINRGKAFADAGNYQKAIMDYDKAVELAPLQIEAYHNRGTAFQSLARYQEAVEDFYRAIKLNPQFARSFNNLGSVYNDLGNQQQAVINYSKAIELDPQFADAYYNLGNVNYALGNYHQAIKDYDKVIEINPRYAAAYGNRGVAFEGVGKYQQAIRDYKQAIALNPENATAYYNLGLLYSELGKPEQGLIYYRRAAGLGLKEAKEFLRQDEKVGP